MGRNLLCILFFACPRLFAADPLLPEFIPPFALGDQYLASAVNLDGKLAIKIQTDGWRSRNVNTSDRVPSEVDGKVMYPDRVVRDSFSPTRHLTVSSSPIGDTSIWDKTGKNYS